jgi:nucleoside-diphosphate-sugar epimerase
MRVLMIGGSGFIGTHCASTLIEQGHTVADFHRGNRPQPAGVESILGDYHQFAQYRARLEEFHPDVAVHCILSNGAQAAEFMRVMRGLTGRTVALSSQDVYRAFRRLQGLDSSPPEPLPLTEDAELRPELNPYGPEALQRLRAVFAWLGDDYDKIPAERAILGDPELPGTVLRLPMVYGPGDPLHRLFPYLRRMDDGRAAIPVSATMNQTFTRGYVENVAAAVVLAALSPQAAGRIYNVAEPSPCPEPQWIEKVAAVVGWSGKVVEIASPSGPPVTQQCVFSSERVRRELGFAEPVNEREALERTIAWERAHPDPTATFDYAAEDRALTSVNLG